MHKIAMYESFIELRLTKTSLTTINRTLLIIGPLVNPLFIPSSPNLESLPILSTGLKWINVECIMKGDELTCWAVQKMKFFVLPKSCRFFITVFSASPPTLGASFCAKTIPRTHDVDKSVRVLPNWATSLRQYYDLCHTPADQFCRVSKTARQRRDRCQTQVSEISNV